MSENLWALREQRKLSVATLASRAGLPIGLIMEYEAGQRSIDVRHIARLARALYVEEAAIRLHSDPRPGTAPMERMPRRTNDQPPRPVSETTEAASPRPRERLPRTPRPAPAPRPPLPPRPSQIAHIQHLLRQLNRSQEEYEAQLGRPLTALDRPGASKALAALQTEIRAGASPNRHRAYLPEAVDQFEQQYLNTVQQAGATVHFSLFDGATLTGQVIGFGPYTITVRQADGSETTINKLALVSYTRQPGREEPAP